MESNVFFYSERGLINCLVLDIKDDIIKLREFLKCIKLGMNEDTPDWVDKVQSSNWYVEFSASEFGNPDLIADLNCDDGHRIIFFEAKMTSYEKAATEIDINQPFNPEKDGIYKGKTSTINAQLALRYRLAKTMFDLKNHRPNQDFSKLIETGIEEPIEVAIRYHDMFKFIRKSQTGRRIHNSLTIDVFNKLMHHAKEYYVVAMTFEDPGYSVFKSLYTHNPKLLPPIGIDEWNAGNHSFGIFNFNEFKTAINPSQYIHISGSRNYINLTMNTGTEIIPDTIEIEESSEIYEDVILSQTPQNIQTLYEEWEDKLSTLFGKKYKPYVASSSILKNGRTIIKLIIQNNSLYLGFRDRLPDILRSEDSPSIIRIQGVSFECIELNRISESKYAQVISVISSSEYK